MTMTQENTIQLSYRELPLQSPEDMWTTLIALVVEGYRGSIQAYPQGGSEESPLTWQLECNTAGPGPVSISGRIGDVLVKVGNAPWEAMTAAERDLRYGGQG